MKKRLLSGLVAAILVISLLPAALAAAPAEAEAAQVLAALDIMEGDENGDLRLGSKITRAEFTKMVVAASTSRDSVGDTVAVKPYPDVPATHWAAPYIKTAVDLGLVQGDLRGYFNPGNTVTLQEGATIVLRLLGYPDSSFTGVWPSGQMAQYRALDLDEGISLSGEDNMTRRDAMYLLYNVLVTVNTSGQYHLNTLEPTLNLVNQNGEIDRVALINSAMEGPVVAEGNWRSALPFDLSTATVYRAGKPSQPSAIQAQDVLYWSEPMRTVWAYTGQATGEITALTPSGSAPTAVTVAGKTYAIVSTDAAYDLSDLGDYRVGDNVTLLLGRNDGVVAVRATDKSGRILCGVVTGVADATYDDGKGGYYEAPTATVRLTDGNEYSYQIGDKDFDAGDLVQVVTEDGTAQLKGLGYASITGKVDADAETLGSYRFADDVEILDTRSNGTAVRVYPDRLANLNMTTGKVRYYVLDTRGDISRLILNDVTGDMVQYGAHNLYTLKEIGLKSVSGSTALDENNNTRTLSDTVVVYELVDGDYKLTSLGRVNDGEHTLTGYYDKLEKDGGRIRAIVAE